MYQVHVNVVKLKGSEALPYCRYYILPLVAGIP